MRVLWVAPNGGRYNNDYKGSGGWVAALESAIVKYTPDIELGIVFISHKEKSDRTEGNVTYLPIYRKKECLIVRWFNHLFFRYGKTEQETNKLILKKIESYKPDIVHIWGCESFYIGIVEHLKMPFVVHIQGIASAVISSYFPIGFSKNDLKKSDGFINYFVLRRGGYFFYKYAEFRVQEELRLSKFVKNWMGRTDWDKRTIQTMSPESNHYYCDELMRDEFFSSKWDYHYDGTINIFTTVGENMYKGVEQILQVAEVLSFLSVNYSWRVCGLAPDSPILHYFERTLGIAATHQNLTFLGKISSSQVRDELLHSDVYVHTSHIENSCNSISEAMLLGVPVIAEYVGGNPSIVQDGGILVQPYSPRLMASYIMEVMDKERALRMSRVGYEISHQRHNPEQIAHSLRDIYNKIIKGGNQI